MREILFRGKWTYSGKWVEGSLLSWKDGKTSINTDNPGEPVWAVDPATIGQYTGLTDKNGVKIFEGDIVDLFGMKGEIVQGCGAFGISFECLIDYDLLESKIPYNNHPLFAYNDNFISLWELWWNYEQDDNPLYEVEVIGNIHDNPERLEVQP